MDDPLKILHERVERIRRNFGEKYSICAKENFRAENNENLRGKTGKETCVHV